MTREEETDHSTTGGPVHVEVKDGKIVRILPIDLDDSDGPGWRIEARGRTFAPPRRTTCSRTVADKLSIYSPKCIRRPSGRSIHPSCVLGVHRPGGRKWPESGYLRRRAR